MIKKYEIKANPLTLTKAVENITKEKHRIMYYDGYITLELFEIKENVTEVYDGELVIDKITEYQKRVIEPVLEVDSEGNETVTDVETWVAVEFKTEIAQIESVIASHDPTPYPEADPNLTPEERIDRLELLVLTESGVL